MTPKPDQKTLEVAKWRIEKEFLDASACLEATPSKQARAGPHHSFQPWQRLPTGYAKINPQPL